MKWPKPSYAARTNFGRMRQTEVFKSLKSSYLTTTLVDGDAACGGRDRAFGQVHCDIAKQFASQLQSVSQSRFWLVGWLFVELAFDF